MPKVQLKLDGMFFVALLVLAALVYLYQKRNLFNPMSSDNIAYQGAAALGDALGIPGEDSRGVPLDDYIFAAIDLLNPFNESDIYARHVILRESIF